MALDDRLRDEAQQQLATHLENCADCRTQLEGLAAGRDWWHKAQSHLAPDPLSGEEASVSQAADPCGDVDKPWLGFLLPTDDDRYLGRFGNYLVTEVIGSGGFGVVLKALDPALNRYVAVKVLSPQLANSGAARRRFAREAQAAAAVVHEHVVAIHSVAENDGLPYLVMAYVAGYSLQDRLDRQGPLEVKEILRIGMQVASGLAAAHAQGLVHRDIKPANILLENGVERVKITDFGLARTIDDASLTASGLIAGTPQYMAPEQARGESVDHRSDLFSLGSVLYAMCTGHSPFRAETFMAVWRRLCIDTPRPIRETNAEIPDWLAEIIEKLHAKEPDDRFESAEGVAELLGRHLAHLQRPTVVPRPARLPAQRWSRGWPRRLRWLGGGGALGCSLAVLAWCLPNPAPIDRSAAVAQAGVETAHEVEADTRSTSAAPPRSGEVGPPEWDKQLMQVQRDVDRLEQELQQPASSLADFDRQTSLTLEAQLEALEREWDSGR
ncbi:MAG TPA: serine/threonine-protein kinase [Pirellulales bacterium]|nr:serine/threonine-protein kinase [Pirellulales bacterium]